jgi:hypothetical protein
MGLLVLVRVCDIHQYAPRVVQLLDVVVGLVLVGRDGLSDSGESVCDRA